MHVRIYVRHFLICGDLNARIADRDDFVPLDFSTHMDTLPVVPSTMLVTLTCLALRRIVVIMQMVHIPVY